MRKLSNITESIWSDIQKRSSGETVRKEDEIDILDGVDLFNYLTKKYKTSHRFMGIVESTSIISIPLAEKVASTSAFNIILYPLYFDYSEHIVFLYENNKKHMEMDLPQLWKKLNDKFTILTTNPKYKNRVLICPSPTDINATNTFLIEVIDFIIDNLDNRSSLIYPLIVKNDVNESIWSDIQKRSAGDTIRKEDEIVSNIKKLKPVDMGVSVLWADKDIEVDGNVYFSYEEVEKIIKNSGWRLPTFREVFELSKNTNEYKNTFEEYKLHSNNNDLIFKKCGFQYANTYGTPRGYGTYYAWTSNVSQSENEAYQTIKIDRYFGITTMHYLNKCCIRLVKDK